MINKEEIIKFIGKVESPFKEKFGIPRQSGLLETAACIVIEPPWSNSHAFRDLEQFSHIWVLWWFHANIDRNFRALIRPPRLGGNKKTGVFASRSMYRPNPIGMSVVALKSMEVTKNYVRLNVVGADMMDGTPVIDIKPYIQFADAVVNAKSGYASEVPERLVVKWSDEANRQLERIIFSQNLQSTAFLKAEQIKSEIESLIACNPSPAYHQSEERLYGVAYEQFNIIYYKNGQQLLIKAVEQSQR